MPPLPSLVKCSLDQAAQHLAEQALAARRGREKTALSWADVQNAATSAKNWYHGLKPEYQAGLGLGGIGAGLGALSQLYGRDPEHKKRRWSRMLTGALAGGLAGGGLGLTGVANSYFPQMLAGSASSGQAGGQEPSREQAAGGQNAGGSPVSAPAAPASPAAPAAPAPVAMPQKSVFSAGGAPDDTKALIAGLKNFAAGKGPAVPEEQLNAGLAGYDATRLQAAGTNPTWVNPGTMAGGAVGATIPWLPGIMRHHVPPPYITRSSLLNRLDLLRGAQPRYLPDDFMPKHDFMYRAFRENGGDRAMQQRILDFARASQAGGWRGNATMPGTGNIYPSDMQVLFEHQPRQRGGTPTAAAAAAAPRFTAPSVTNRLARGANLAISGLGGPRETFPVPAPRYDVFTPTGLLRQTGKSLLTGTAGAYIGDRAYAALEQPAAQAYLSDFDKEFTELTKNHPQLLAKR